LKRLRTYTQVAYDEVKPIKIRKGRPEAEILSAEGDAIARRVAPGDYVVALDRSGCHYDSEELAKWLEGLSVETKGWVCLAIGGPLGLSKVLLERSDKVLSLSKLTLTHEMTRLVLLEQLYRAFTIMRGQKYHK